MKMDDIAIDRIKELEDQILKQEESYKELYLENLGLRAILWAMEADREYVVSSSALQSEPLH